MDLHQGDNDYNPLRTKPMTAAMKQDQKHIEGSVYDPRTGETVVSTPSQRSAVVSIPKLGRRDTLFYLVRERDVIPPTKYVFGVFRLLKKTIKNSS